MSALPPWPYPRWIAHRGAGQLAPENTLAAFRLGMQYGWRMFECDAKLSADDEVFLMHDATLERTTNGHGMAGQRSWHALSQLDAGGWHSRTYAGEPLLRLDHLARYCLANTLLLNIEIKPTPGTERHTGEVVAREAARLWASQPVPPLLSSFETETLQGARTCAPQLPRALLLDDWWDGWFEQALALGCVAVVAHHPLWNTALLAQVHRAGMRCLSYTVNDESVARQLLALGIDGLISDRVDLFNPAQT
ncbi:MAG: glycerophosphodiester phosphodiesterase [Betaproteobacteria bacterium]|nr:glycerophosphodiester phosphodiesterase [Betaproteobacteria bacterium]